MENENIRKELVVSAIENGSVIDHIPAKSVFRVVKMLNLEDTDTQVTVGFNLESRKYGRKGIIKVSNKYFENEEVNKIALVAPTATLIVIKDYKVTEKRNVKIPDEISKIVKCVNPNCITNHQQVATRFTVIDKEDLKLQCHYCEKITGKNNIDII
ncbi:aspartate carbamoyltransferase regulatory subunit [Lentimicrobium sp.]|jgi:aspartate carbamoyltransferase regulatory subunit|uniref:aspartate carbamoyltransferase regulatory subunit n=1 Tax=Lentimicrobium sp. TaxID=2034841 RepID=UPI0025E90019|nr:aspartate carbamoyltransferase regulatory subunit [Lentimicrobium sp.]MCO5255610.1 aspartate carbamoyltransferase regulatory subunit [Lentimicrobium sp.]MCO5261576.1 aspartate carbamoyltransferase regulatory subunit [Lentimicrobium sp.]HPF63480.1 aspartate carbamoyltransferase regulatory subunit [Lentimicrobium sp.]HPJ61436.1 aspartate carbamoyltransferase regulatory subunit [Lentimicrobium sp.]HPR25242.1 aspartate carbamoyltransferase regulatory subunit [Lentimicrobium sp.]